MRRTIYEGTRKLSDISRSNPSDPRTPSCLNSSEPIPDMTSNQTFLLNPSYSSTNLSDKHIARRRPSLTNPMNNYGRRNDKLYFRYYQAQHINKHLVIPILLMFCSQDPLPPSGVDALINPFAVFLTWSFHQSLAAPSLHFPSPNFVPMLLPSHGILATSPNIPCLGS